MNVIMENELKGYCKQIKQVLTVSPKGKKIILQGLQNDIEEYLEQCPDATIDDIRAHFGAPAEIEAESLFDITSKDMKRYARRKKIIVTLILILIVSISTFLGVYFSMSSATPGIIRETGKYEESNHETITAQNY